jgi:hypothetical protein
MKATFESVMAAHVPPIASTLEEPPKAHKGDQALVHYVHQQFASARLAVPARTVFRAEVPREAGAESAPRQRTRGRLLTPAEQATNKTMMICCAGSKSERLVLDL